MSRIGVSGRKGLKSNDSLAEVINLNLVDEAMGGGGPDLYYIRRTYFWRGEEVHFMARSKEPTWQDMRRRCDFKFSVATYRQLREME